MAEVTTCSDFAAGAKSLQSCPTLCNPIDGSPPGSPVPGILQARTNTGVGCFRAQENKVCHCFHCFPICHEMMGPDAMILVF